MTRRVTAENYAQTASEREIQTAIVEYAQFSGWLVIETSQPAAVKGGLIGVPDLILIKKGTVVFMEVKTATGKLRQSQIEFRDRIQQHTTQTCWYAEVHDLDAAIKVIATAQYWSTGRIA